jgi:hypothetical protein
MKKLIAGLIGSLLLTGGVLFANNLQPAQHIICPNHPACTHCTKATSDKDSKQTVKSDSKDVCPDKANCVCPHK